ncbi:MAG: ribosome-associated heat shock protein Hsp15 [Pseudomonadota bacterium]
MTKNRKENSIRLDKWLWAARFYKTRALARQMVQSGKVHYDGQRSKPSKIVQVGAVITLRQGFDTKEVEVLALSEQRRGASEAQLLYQETAESVERREQNAEARKLNALYNPHPEGRPDKKQRRQLIRMKDSGE